jgi:hypothetical protein
VTTLCEQESRSEMYESRTSNALGRRDGQHATASIGDGCAAAPAQPLSFRGGEGFGCADSLEARTDTRRLHARVL